MNVSRSCLSSFLLKPAAGCRLSPVCLYAWMLTGGPAVSMYVNALQLSHCCRLSAQGRCELSVSSVCGLSFRACWQKCFLKERRCKKNMLFNEDPSGSSGSVGVKRLVVLGHPLVALILWCRLSVVKYVGCGGDCAQRARMLLAGDGRAMMNVLQVCGPRVCE